MQSRQLTKEEVVLQAIQSGRAFAEAIANLPQPNCIKDGRGIRALIDQLLAGELDTITDTMIADVRGQFVAGLDAFAPGYGARVFAGCSEDTPSADPTTEAIRQGAELFKRFCRARQLMLDHLAAKRVLMKLQQKG